MSERLCVPPLFAAEKGRRRAGEIQDIREPPSRIGFRLGHRRPLTAHTNLTPTSHQSGISRGHRFRKPSRVTAKREGHLLVAPGLAYPVSSSSFRRGRATTSTNVAAGAP
ncbi:hypothetical protein F2Q68_00035917 [Brassica cretica]|uniref:Uncharacterized protein n=1 Tax=Brassica cretica TaxID=69181 RepID=A0A8S9GXR0_BRACR|nr:hypothetical protein F2Q68_00035917 [Brassica cretica]